MDNVDQVDIREATAQLVFLIENNLSFSIKKMIDYLFPLQIISLQGYIRLKKR
jgi:hypothetical protein